MNKAQNFLENLKAMERFSGHTFDPTTKQGFDPTTQMRFQGTAQQVQKTSTDQVNMTSADQTVQFTVSVANTMLADLVIELFQFDSSQTSIYSPDVNDYHPSNAMGPILTFSTGTANTYLIGPLQANLTSFVNNAGVVPTGNTPNTVGFDENGNLVYRPGYVGGALPAGNVTISCAEVSYKKLFNYSGKFPFRIDKMRMTFTADAQIQQNITQVQKTWLGATTTNKVQSNTYKSPFQFQPLIVDVPTPLQITSECGLQYKILGLTNSGAATVNTATFNMFLSSYAKPNL